MALINQVLDKLGFVMIDQEKEAYKLEVKKAWEQWQTSLAYFNSVSDPDLVDYAIYDVEATRRRYIYMLRNAEKHLAQAAGDIQELNAP